MQVPDTWPVRGRGIAFFIYIGSLAFCGVGYTQQPGNPLDLNEESPAAQQVVVTASKRPETLTQAPMAVSVLTQEQLQRTGAEEIQDLMTLVPAFEVQTVGAANSIQLAIRGVTNSDFNAGNPAVATYVDGIYIGRTQGLNYALYDLERIEVLRGPQGTLYGRNATGGNVNIITADPRKSFGASAAASYGNYNDVAFHGMLNVPLSADLALRVALVAHQNDGYYDTEGTTARNYGKSKDYAGRFTALWTPDGNFTWRFSIDDFGSRGTPALDFDTSAGGRPTDGLPVFERPVSSYPDPSNEIDNLIARSRTDWHLSDQVALSYVAGYQHAIYKSQFASTGHVFDGQRDGGTRSYSHELALSYEAHRLSNILGATYFHEVFTGNDAYHLYALGLTYAADAAGPAPFTTAASGAFDQATYGITEKLRVIGGLRFSHETQDLASDLQAFCPINLYPGLSFDTIRGLFAPGCFSQSIAGHSGSWSNTSWKTGVGYDLSAHSSSYLTVTTGFKSGGLNPGPVTPVRFLPEKVTAYELGMKSEVPNRARLNVAVYYEDYNDLQVTQLAPMGNAQITGNAARATIYGFEAEGFWQIAEADRLEGFLDFLRASYSTYTGAVDQQTGVIYSSLAGRTLPDAPRVSARLQYSHSFGLQGSGTLVPSATVYWQSTEYLRGFDLPIDRVSSFAKTDLGLTYLSPSRYWKIQGYARNLENNVTRNNGFTAVGHYFSDYDAPRTFGVRATYTY